MPFSYIIIMKQNSLIIYPNTEPNDGLLSLNTVYFVNILLLTMHKIIFLQGNSNLVYNRTFFYHQRNSANLVRYELFSGVASKLILPRLLSNTSNFLYKGSKDYVDLGVDENGLWVIYGLPQAANNTVVAKIDPNTLKVSTMV